MITEAQARDVLGSTAYDQHGDKIGKVGQLFLDDRTGRPDFVTVNTGLFGLRESYVPVGDASLDGDRLTVPFDKAHVKDAPHVDLDDDHLDAAERERLHGHYGLDQRQQHHQQHQQEHQQEEAGAGRHASAETIEHPEHVPGGYRLRKYVTTELETHTVPVRKEHVVVEPVDGGESQAHPEQPGVTDGPVGPTGPDDQHAPHGATHEGGLR